MSYNGYKVEVREVYGGCELFLGHQRTPGLRETRTLGT
jgi:hypothetical protein